MKMKIVLMALVAMIATGQAQNLVTNGDFEGGTFVADGVPDGWSAQTGTVHFTSTSGGNPTGWYSISTTYDRVANWKQGMGNKFVECQGWYSGYYDGITQDITVSGNANYAYSFRTKVNTAISGATGTYASYNGYEYYCIRLYWDGPGWITMARGWQAQTALWQTFTGTFSTPAGETGATMAVYGYGNYSTSQHLAQAYDDISITLPEPLTMSLLGLGGLMLRRRKK